MNVRCNEKIIKLYIEVYYRSFHEYNPHLFCYSTLLKIVERMFPEFSCNDITKGIHYLVKEQIIFKEYRFICVDILSRGILDNMFSIFMQDEFTDFADFAFDSNDNDIDDLCSELETDLHTLRSQQAFYHRRLSGSLLDPILEVDEEEEDVKNIDDKKKEEKRIVELVYDTNDEGEDEFADDADDEYDEGDANDAGDDNDSDDDIFKPST